MKFFHFKKKHTEGGAPRHGLFHHFSQDAEVDWSFIFNLFIVATIAFLVVGFYVYTGLDKRLQGTPAKIGSSLSLFDEQALTKVIRQFGDNAAERTSVLQGYSGPNDPSL